MWQGFDWDSAKAASNLIKHGVSFEQAKAVFDDPLSRTIDDEDHSFDEKRFITIGRSADGELIVVCHCDSGEFIRIISARYAEKQERRDYEYSPK